MKLMLGAAFSLLLLMGCTTADKDYIRDHVVQAKHLSAGRLAATEHAAINSALE